MSVQTENSDPSIRLVGYFREAESYLYGNSPELINQHRKKALQDFLIRGIPSRKNENYKYTNLQPSFLQDFNWLPHREITGYELPDLFKCHVPRLDVFQIILMNGWFHSTNGFLPEGVFAGSLERFAVENRKFFREYYTKITDGYEDPLVSLNTAFARDGYVLYVPANVKIEKPVQVINLLKAQGDIFVTQRNLVIVEPGAEVKLIICDHTLNLNQYLSNSATEVFIGGNASVEFLTLQNHHNQSVMVNSSGFHLERDSRLTTQTITLHGGLVRNNVEVILDGTNSEANLYGVSFTDRKQHVDNFIRVLHEKPECRSNQLYRNVLDNESSGAFSGRIHVKRDAQKTNAYQKNNNLLLTDKAQMQTKPQLIIEADDVKCSHGATVGQIDEEALFYLRARGIGENQARLMLTNAFSYEVVRQIDDVTLRDQISELVGKRLTGEIGRCHESAYRANC